MRPGIHFWNAVAYSGVGLLAAYGPLAADPPARRAVRNALVSERAFARQQLSHTRVHDARNATQGEVERLFEEKKIPYPAAEVYLRAFKRDRVLELWVRSEGRKQFQLLKSYPICALSGVAGPKRREGDRQVPEGFYFVNLFNPASQYHLSLRIDYPNQRDRTANSASRRLGGDIYIHGGCKSDGCLAITDQGIRELYWIAVEARSMGQEHIPVHIFPARLDRGEMRWIEQTYADDPALVDFWTMLKPGYDYFEKTRRVPPVVVDTWGKYRVDDAGFPIRAEGRAVAARQHTEAFPGLTTRRSLVDAASAGWEDVAGSARRPRIASLR